MNLPHRLKKSPGSTEVAKTNFFRHAFRVRCFCVRSFPRFCSRLCWPWALFYPHARMSLAWPSRISSATLSRLFRAYSGRLIPEIPILNRIHKCSNRHFAHVHQNERHRKPCERVNEELTDCSKLPRDSRGSAFAPRKHCTSCKQCHHTGCQLASRDSQCSTHHCCSWGHLVRKRCRCTLHICASMQCTAQCWCNMVSNSIQWEHLKHLKA